MLVGLTARDEAVSVSIENMRGAKQEVGWTPKDRIGFERLGSDLLDRIGRHSLDSGRTDSFTQTFRFELYMCLCVKEDPSFRSQPCFFFLCELSRF